MNQINFVGTNFCGLTTMDMFVDALICGFQIIPNSTKKVNKYFVGILNLWIALPTRKTKLNVQEIKMISQYAYKPTQDRPME